MFRESELVYETLRNSIIHCEDNVKTGKIYMFTVYFALMALGFSYNRHLFLVSYFILIAFQSMINDDRIAIERMSAYIRVFFELKRDDMHWELLNKDADHLIVYKAQYRNLGWYVNLYGSSILSVVTFISSFLTILETYSIKNIPGDMYVELMTALFLCGITIYINTRLYVSKDGCDHKVEIIDSSINKFYLKCCNESKETPKTPSTQETSKD